MIYCDDHTHQLKTTSHTHTKKKKTFKTITFIGPVHHTHRNISNKNFYRASSPVHHTYRNITNKNFLGQYITHTETFPTKTFIGPVHHTHTHTHTEQKHYKEKLFWASTSHTQKTFHQKLFGPVPVHHTHRKFYNKNFFWASTSHTQKTFQQKIFGPVHRTHRKLSNKNFFGPVHHTHRKLYNKNFLGQYITHTNSSFSKFE